MIKVKQLDLNILKQITETTDQIESLFKEKDILPIEDRSMTEKKLEALRKKYKNMPFLSGKIDFLEPIPEDLLKKIIYKIGILGKTINIGKDSKSIILSTGYFPEEISTILFLLEKQGLLTSILNLEIGISGRLPNSMAGILGSSMLLSGTNFMETSLEKGKINNSKGKKFITHDELAKKDYLNKISNKNIGNTNISGIKDFSFIYTYHLIGTLLNNVLYQGKHKREGINFINEYKSILKRYGIDDVLLGDRINNGELHNETEIEKYDLLIKKCIDKYEEDIKKSKEICNDQGSLLFDIKNLFKKYKKKLYYK